MGRKGYLSLSNDNREMLEVLRTGEERGTVSRTRLWLLGDCPALAVRCWFGRKLRGATRFQRESFLPAACLPVSSQRVPNLTKTKQMENEN